LYAEADARIPLAPPHIVRPYILVKHWKATRKSSGSSLAPETERPPPPAGPPLTLCRGRLPFWVGACVPAPESLRPATPLQIQGASGNALQTSLPIFADAPILEVLPGPARITCPRFLLHAAGGKNRPRLHQRSPGAIVH